jgi:hypothetical protein
MDRQYDRNLLRSGGQAVIWHSADEGELIQGVEKVKVLKLAAVREEELDVETVHFVMTLHLEYRGDTNRRRSNQFKAEFSFDDIRSKLSRRQFSKKAELPKLTHVDKTVYDALVRYYKENELKQFKKKMRAVRNLIQYGKNRHAVYLIWWSSNCTHMTINRSVFTGVPAGPKKTEIRNIFGRFPC